MSPAALALARAGHVDATQAADDLWAAVVERVAVGYASTALDMISSHVGADVSVPNAVLSECCVRLGLFLRNSEVTMGHASVGADGYTFRAMPAGSALRSSGVTAMLGPWIVRRAGLV